MKSQFFFCILLLNTFIIFSSKAQVVGGREPGEISPQVKEPIPLNGDGLSGNVNLFNGTYNGSYALGSVSTQGGLNFDLSLNYSSNVSGGGTVPLTKGIPYGDG